MMQRYLPSAFLNSDYLVYYQQVYSAGLVWYLVRGNKVTHIKAE